MANGSKPEPVRWETTPGVVRTIAEEAFNGWDDAISEAVKNALDADATRIHIRCPETAALVPHAEQHVVVEDNGHGMSPEDLRTKYCRHGRHKLLEDGKTSPNGRPYLGRRGTGKIAGVVVSHRVTVESWREGLLVRLSYTRDELQRSASPDAASEAADAGIELESVQHDGQGTRITLASFSQDHGVPTERSVHGTLIRHFGRIEGVQFSINGEPFDLIAHADLLHEIVETEVEGVGMVSGALWRTKQKLDEPGVVVVVAGQRVYGPAMFGVEPSTYGGEFRKTLDRLVGQVQLTPAEDKRVSSGSWTMTAQFGEFGAWLAPLLTDAVARASEIHLKKRVDTWLADPKTRREFDTLDDFQKATAKRIILGRAKRSNAKGVSEQEKVIARLIIRAIRLSSLGILLDAIEDSEDETIDALGEMLSGEDAWSLKQVTLASTVVKAKLKALDELEAVTSDKTYNEDDAHRILEANPWMLADDYHSFRSNRQIKTTLRDLFGINTDAPTKKKRPDFCFVLGDAASIVSDQTSRFLFVELKGPGQPLCRDHQNQVIGDACTFMEHLPGFSYCVLLGVTEKRHQKPDESSAAPGRYEFKSMTYTRLIERARFRLRYLSDGVDSDEAAQLAKRWAESNEHELQALVSEA